jgi:hypothetical protein
MVLKLKKGELIDSSIKIGSNNEFDRDTAIGHNVNIIKNINVSDNSVNYKTSKENVFFSKKAYFLIDRYGEKNIRLIGLINLIASIITLFVWINSNFPNGITFPYLPVVSKEVATLLLFLWIGLLLIGAFFIGLVSYSSSSKCENCKKKQAYEEKKSNVKEINTSEGIRKITYRNYKCKFCGHEVTREFNELIRE